MANMLIAHTSPKELIAIVATLNGTVITTGYKVCLKPNGVTPDKTDVAWQDPDVATPDSGVLVGPDVGRAYNEGVVVMPYAWVTDSTESVIFPCPPAWQFT